MITVPFRMIMLGAVGDPGLDGGGAEFALVTTTCSTAGFA